VGGPPDTLTLPVVQNGNWFRFKPNTSTSFPGGYLVQGITTVAPEPGTMVLLATGLVALAGVGSLSRRRNRS